MLYQEISPVLISVSQAIGLCNTLFQDLELWIEGEIVNFSSNRDKFIFFDLKDESAEARISCFMMAYQMPFPLENGLKVTVRARPGIHQKSGQFRLTIQKIEPRGQGSAKRAFELLRQKLQDEGLFAPERKRRLPRLVQNVGLITSTEAAAYGDFKTIAFQRLPGVHFYLVNSAVQGKDAEAEIVRAFDFLNSTYSLDAIVLVRGGGSQEDLHAFNSELVARAIARSKAPVVVGVGHERDISIADFCADLRTSTPSNAAQLLLPTKEEIFLEVQNCLRGMHNRTQKQLQLQKERCRHQGQALRQSLLFRLQNYRQATLNRIKNIEALSPYHILERGFSISYDQNGQVLKNSSQVKPDQEIVTQLHQGRLHARISKINP